MLFDLENYEKPKTQIDTVYNRLKQDIIYGVIPEGSFFSNEEISGRPKPCTRGYPQAGNGWVGAYPAAGGCSGGATHGKGISGDYRNAGGTGKTCCGAFGS